MGRRARFVVLTQYYSPEPGAASVRLEAMAQELRRHGNEVVVVTAFPHHLGFRDETRRYHRRFVVEDEVDGIRVIRTWIWAIPRKRFWWRLFGYFSFVLTSFFGLWRLGPADYLIVESPPLFLGIAGYVWGKFRGIPYILSVSDLWPESAVALGLVTNPLLIRATRWLEYWLYAHAFKVSVVTEGIRQGVLDSGVVTAEDVLFFPNGVDLARFGRQNPDSELAAHLDLDGKKMFLYPGTLGYAQGLQIIIDAADFLRERNDVVFVLVGDGPVRGALERQAARLGLTSVCFEGLQPLVRMPQYFSLATAVVVPLRRHKLFAGARPSKVFPAWASGTPIIFCGEGEMATLVEESGGGVVVPPEDGAGLAMAVDFMTRLTSVEWQAMANQGRRFVEKHYTWEVITGRWLDALWS